MVNDRKRKRKRVAGTPKTMARKQMVAAVKNAAPSKPPSAVRKRKSSKQAPPRAPMVPPGRAEITEPVPFDGIGGTTLQSVSADVGIAMELGAETNPSALLRPDWKLGADEALRNAIEAYEYYRRARAFFGPLEAGLRRDRDNRLDDVPHALAELREDEATVEATIRVLREQRISPTPSAASIQQAGYVFRTLTHGAKSFGSTVSRWIAEGVVKGEAAQFAPGLIDQLLHALHKTAEVIASLFQ